MYVCADAILKEFKCFYIDFEETKLLPSTLMGMKEGDSFDEFLAAGRYFFFGDEIHCLYEANPSKEDPKLTTVRQLYRLGKSSCPTFISGSSVHTAAYAFKQFERLGLPAKDFSAYPDLNHTVFREFTLLPLRTKVEMKKFAESQASKAQTEKELNELFIYSGGVPRLIQPHLANERSQSAETKLREELEKDPDLLELFLSLC
jgi:hypothetical protein